MLQAEKGSLVVGGYIGDPSCGQTNSQLQYLFLNGRWVRDRGLFQAVQDAYRGLLMTGRYPVAFLFLEVPPDQVDVNVHPTKAEVRFRDKESLHQLVQTTVHDCLHQADLTARMQLGTKKDRMVGPESKAQPSRPSDETARTTAPEENRAASAKPEPMPAAARQLAPALGTQDSPRQEGLPMALATTISSPSSPGLAAPPATGSEQKELPTGNAGRQQQAPRSAPTQSAPAAVLRAMQVLDCYLVVELPPDEVLFIDQHALHERILFEQLQQRVRSGTLEVQRLLIPEPVSLPPSQAALVLEQRQALADLGLLVEDFGGGTVLLTGYPALLGKRPPKDVLQAVVDHLVSRERAPSREQLLNDLLSLLACHGAVRAGDRLTNEEIAALLAQRELAQDSHHCPHGRPTSLHFSRHDLERQFRRI
jgi:DNA mismatch repair protein MutL